MSISYVVNIDEFSEKIISELKKDFRMETERLKGRTTIKGFLIEGETELDGFELGLLKVVDIFSLESKKAKIEISGDNFSYQIQITNKKRKIVNDGLTFIGPTDKIKIETSDKILLNLTFLLPSNGGA